VQLHCAHEQEPNLGRSQADTCAARADRKRDVVGPCMSMRRSCCEMSPTISGSRIRA